MGCDVWRGTPKIRKPERGRFLREFGHATCSLHAGLRREAETRTKFCSSLCPEELRLMALWMVARPKTRKTSRRQGFVVSAWRALCCSDGVSFAPGVSCHQHIVGLFGISSCLEAPSEKDEVEEATEALPRSLFLLVRASQFCVAPAGQSKLRSGGLCEGSLTLACLRMCPLLQVSRNKAVDEALFGVSCLSVFVRRMSMSLRGCLCRLPQHRPLTRSKMPSRPCLRECCC